MAERERALVFGEVAEVYERRRPGYPDALYDRVLGAAAGAQRALEAGAGTGRATVALARRGLEVVAVEPDAAMAAIARRTCAGLRVGVVDGRFEDWDGPAGEFDLVICAQAWHWIDPVRGAAVAQRTLRPGGAFARWWNNQGATGHDPVWRAIHEAYRREVPDLMPPPHGHREEARDHPPIEGFGSVHVHHFDWSQIYAAAAYAELISTYSTHRLLEPAQLHRLQHAVVAAIEEAGDGTLLYPYRTRLLLARRDATQS